MLRKVSARSAHEFTYQVRLGEHLCDSLSEFAVAPCSLDVSKVSAYHQRIEKELRVEHTYEKDIVAWAQEQAKLLRSGQFSQLDLEHIAQEIEDVGKSEQRELASRMAVLMAHLLKWEFQPALRSTSWQLTIRDQRIQINKRLQRTPSLRRCLADADWLADAWVDALGAAVKETGLSRAIFPDDIPWDAAQVLDAGFYPQEVAHYQVREKPRG